jgi:flagellar hook-associated protein 2
LLGSAGSGSGSVEINSVSIGVNFATDSLETLRDNINASAAGVTASIRTVEKDGKTTYKLDIAGSGSTPTWNDPNQLLQSVGVLQRSVGNELVAAQDAEYKLDGIALTSSSNTITGAIPGATLTLLKANALTPETSVLNLTRDNDAIKKKVTDFMNTYNQFVDFVRSNSQFDKETFSSGPLFGDPSVQQIEAQIAQSIFDNVSGLSGTYRNLASIGFGIDENGKLTLDESALTTAMNTDLTNVSNLFRVRGETTATGLNFVSITSASKVPGAAGYEVNISAIATKGAYTGETAQLTASTVSERLRFNGSLFGNTDYDLTLALGSTATDAVNAINSDAKLKDIVVASLDAGRLKIESKRYGSGGNFTVYSSLEAAADNTGIGVGSLGTVYQGVDVQGTINGEAATGNGQFLTGATTASNVKGVQIQYTGTALGLVGNVKFSRGVGEITKDLVSTMTDSVNGLITATDNGFTSQIDDIEDSIATMRERMTAKESLLRQQFLRMETAISELQQQSARLSSMQSS